MTTEANRDCWSAFLSPLRLIVLAVNAMCFGGFLAFLAAGEGGVVITVLTGVMFFSLLTGALVASCRARAARNAARNAAATEAVIQKQEHDA